MADKEWIISHAKARAPITIRGKNLKTAIESEGLDPNLWKPISPEQPEENPPDTEPSD